MIAWMRAFAGWWTRRHVAYAGAAVVAVANAAISYISLSATTRALHAPDLIAVLFPFGADGIIAVATPATIELRDAPVHVKAQAWALLLGAVAVSVVGNAARAPVAWAGSFYGLPIPSGDAIWFSIPPLAYAGSLHVLGLMHRYAPPLTTHTGNARASVRSGRAVPVARTRRAGARRPEAPVVLPDGRTVSAGHARKVRAALNRASEAA